MPEEEQDQGTGGARPFWSGTITFGLVSVPVALMPAQRSVGTSLRMVSPEGTPLERRYFSTTDDRPLTWDDIVRGYAVEKDRYVVIDDDELEKIAPERTRDIDLRLFVTASEIDRIHFERAYYLTPAGDSTKAYRLLARVMEESDRAGIATFVMRGKEYLVAILAERGILRAETLRFAEEVRTPETVGLPEPVDIKLTDIRKLEKEIGKLAKPSFDTKELVDKSDDLLLELVREKVKAGKDVYQVDEEDKEEDTSDVLDLVALLQRSLNGGADAAMKQTKESEGGGAKSPKKSVPKKGSEKQRAKDPASSRSSTKEKSGGGANGSSRGSAKAGGASGKAASEKTASGKTAATKTARKKSSTKGKKDDDLGEYTRTELYEEAKKLDIAGRSEMSREELADAIHAAR